MKNSIIAIRAKKKLVLDIVNRMPEKKNSEVSPKVTEI